MNKYIDNDVMIIGELITEIKIPSVLSEIIASYLTPHTSVSIVLNELEELSNTLLNIDGIDPTPIDIIEFINIIKSK